MARSQNIVAWWLVSKGRPGHQASMFWQRAISAVILVVPSTNYVHLNFNLWSK